MCAVETATLISLEKNDIKTVSTLKCFCNKSVWPLNLAPALAIAVLLIGAVTRQSACLFSIRLMPQFI